MLRKTRGLGLGALILTGLVALGFACRSRDDDASVKDAAADAQADSDLPPASAAAFPVTFDSIWAQVKEGAYQAQPWPEHRTLYATFWDGSKSLLAVSAGRTLSDRADILPSFQKLVHPIGICYAASWAITEPSTYTGYFAEGAQGLMIVRASEAMGVPRLPDYRSFGFAGKLFAVTDPSAPITKPSANFFTVDDLGGTKAKSYLDTMKTNEPAVSFHPSSTLILPTLVEITKTFAKADQHPGFRQLYEVAELGLPSPQNAVTPHWIGIKADTKERLGKDDFRDELRLGMFPNGLSFGIFTAEKKDQWKRLGTITIKDEAFSEACDHRLHFHHPSAK